MKKFLSASLMVASFIFTPSSANALDEDEVRDIVRQEIQRALTNDQLIDPVIERGIQRLIAREQTGEQQARAANLREVDPKRDHIFGNLNAEVTLVEYSDFECPFCKRFHPTAIKLAARNADKLRWVYRHFPLDFHNPGAQKQAEASECVAELKGNDTFWDFIHAIYERTTAGGNGFPLRNLRPLAEELSVDGAAFERCLNSGRMAARVQADYQNGVAIGITGTPAGVLMNRRGESRFIVGAVGYDELQGMVDELSR